MGREHVVREYQAGAGPEEIALRFPTVSLEQIYATITYYLANQEAVTEYMQRIWQEQEAAWQEQQRNSSEFVISLRTRLEKQRQELQVIGIKNIFSQTLN